MSRKLVSFDWAMKKILRQKANLVILEPTFITPTALNEYNMNPIL